MSHTFYIYDSANVTSVEGDIFQIAHESVYAATTYDVLDFDIQTGSVLSKITSSEDIHINSKNLQEK